MRFLPIVTQIFLWAAVFSGRSLVDHRSSHIAGYTYNDFIAYYLLTVISRAASSMPGLASGIARDIRDGSVKKYLIQPIDMVGFLLLTRVAHKLVYYGVAVGPFALVYFLCRGYFPGWPDAAGMVGFLASLGMAFLLGFFLECRHRHDRLLVFGNQFAGVRLHAVYVLLFRAYVSAGHAPRRVGRRR